MPTLHHLPRGCKTHSVASGAALVNEFRDWLIADSNPRWQEKVADAGMFVRWRLDYSTGVLDAIDEDDLVEFLLDWVPRMFPGTADDADELCRSVASFIDFLGETGRLAGGRKRVDRLVTLTNRLARTVRAAVTSPADVDVLTVVFGHPMINPPGQPRYSELLADASLSEEDLEAVVDSRIAAYQALPDNERGALRDRFLDDEPVELPFLYVPPPPAEVEAAAAAAPLLRKIEALREYLGTPGRALTAKGNIKRADGKALIELLNTGDEMDPQIGDRTFRTSTTGRLPGLNSIVTIAKNAGAVRVYKGRLMPTKAWPSSATERAAAAHRAIVKVGALGARGNLYPIFDAVHTELDGATVHWLASLLAPDIDVEVDALIETAEPILRDEIEPYWPQWSEGIESLTRRGISKICETLEAAGVIEWTDRREEASALESYPTGGTIRLTALGRHVVPESLPEAGYVLRRVDDLADAPVEALIDTLDWGADEQRQSVVDAWQPTVKVSDRVGRIVEFIGSADDSASRLKGFAALELFDDAAVGPALRSLLDGPAAGHSAVYLLSRGLADESEVRGLVDIGVFVDVLAASLDDPDELCEMFANAPQTADQYTALEQMWQHPAPETQLVLDAIGQHHPDRKVAKAARKAAIKHRSWMANRN